MTRPHSTRNTSIRTRNIRGEDNLLSSISISEREEGPEGIEGCIRCEKRRWGNQYGTAWQREKLRSPISCRRKWNFTVKPRFDLGVFLGVFGEGPAADRDI